MSDKRAVFGEDGNATMTGFATCYSYSQATGEYLEEFEFWTLIGSGIPANSTLLEPPKSQDKKTAVFFGDEWQLLADHRGETVYSVTDGTPSIVKVIGEYPTGTTPEKPSTPYDKWDGKAWVTDADDQKNGDVEKAKAKKSSLLSEVDSYTRSWQTQLMLGIINDKDKQTLTEWMRYYQKVQAVDLSLAPDITWPEKPTV